MGFLGKLWKVIDPFVPDEAVRGVGRIARGDFKRGLGDIGTGALDLGRGALVAGTAGAAVPGLAALPGVAQIASLGSKVPGLSKIASIGGSIGGAGGAGSTLGQAPSQGFLGNLGNLIRNNPQTAIDVVSGIYGAADASRRRGFADRLGRQGLAREQARDAELAPLREMAIRGLTGPRPEQPDLSSIYADPGNPFSRRGPRVMLPSTGTFGSRP